MIITNIGYERLELELLIPYTIAYEEISKATNFILKIETDGPIVGFGCAAPDITVTHESPEDVEHDIQNSIIPILKGKNPFMVSQILEELSHQLPQKSSALAMVDMALLDISAKKMQVPLYQFLGGYRHEIATSITIGILPLEETLKLTEEYVRQGFFILKIKGGLSLEEDIEKLQKIREQFPKIQLRFDGNQGYSVDETVAFDNAVKDVNIEILEQPTKPLLDKYLGEVKNTLDLPIMADESLKSVKDAFRLAKNQRIDMVNIKLMKVGGIHEGMRVNTIAKAAHLEAMVGCLDECSLGISAGLHFALSRSNVKYADLDGHLEFKNDPFSDLLQLKNGILKPSKNYGLGLKDW
ncbi:mandelate racemase/muconate lactonizing enzyme family protein [Muricauda sp. MAR_2010_75]|jgi:L-alanine-DL-glutamate epimerase-like enolase superfamily enzyme|uniref:mandelate racemase/muconate lactonizing enzyme family protein n=1 Tax=Allomuricauda sp. MAR_2010_75 TaxID=1250232 RepID=UPI0005611B91|nr:dipeptide epimerase [Muricauda sp. MAR_2010_75]